MGIRVPHTRISKMRTAKPRTPPPAPICCALPMVVSFSLDSGAAKVRAARHRCRSMVRVGENMVVAVVDCGCVGAGSCSTVG